MCHALASEKTGDMAHRNGRFQFLCVLKFTQYTVIMAELQLLEGELYAHWAVRFVLYCMRYETCSPAGMIWLVLILLLYVHSKCFG